jgi:hypothetical protein
LSSVKRCNKIKREHTNLRIVLLPYMMYLFLQSFRHLLRVGGIGKKAPSTFVDNAQQLVPVGGVGDLLGAFNINRCRMWCLCCGNNFTSLILPLNELFGSAAVLWLVEFFGRVHLPKLHAS